MKTLKAEYLLEGDVTRDGLVIDTFGMGPEVLVDFADGTSKRYPRDELVEVA
jgi:hypothetical protein